MFSNRNAVAAMIFNGAELTALPESLLKLGKK
jgi:hypothetical protein